MLLLISGGLPLVSETCFLSTVFDAPAFRFQSFCAFSCGIFQMRLQPAKAPNARVNAPNRSDSSVDRP